MLRLPPAGGRMEKRIFLPSNDTHGSLMAAPTKLVIGVTTPSGEMGDNLYKLPSAQLRFSDSSPFVLTKTKAAVVSSSTMTSSGALSRHPKPDSPSTSKAPASRYSPSKWFVLAVATLMMLSLRSGDDNAPPAWQLAPQAPKERETDGVLEIVVGNGTFRVELLSQHGGTAHLGAQCDVVADVELEAAPAGERVLG